MRRLLALFALLGAFAAVPPAEAQTQTRTQTRTAAQAAPNGPAAVADRAVRGWLARPPFDPLALSGRPVAEVCRELPELVSNPAPPAGTRVNFANRVEREATPTARRYTYPVTFPGERLAVLEVSLTRPSGEGAWQVGRVGVQTGTQGQTIPAALQNPAAGLLFAALSLGLVYLLTRPSFFRRWLAEGWGYLREHRAVVVAAFVLLYGLFGLGVLTGANLPPSCTEAVTQLVAEGVSQLGAAQAYESGNVPRAAVVTLYQNFVMGTLVTTYGVAFISFGVLAYLVNGLRFLALGVPFGFLTQADPVTLLAVGVLVVVELSAYVLVTAGGGMLLVTLVRRGFASFRLALRKLTMMLPLVLLLLVVGAWYEAVIIIVPALLGGP